MTNGTYIEKIDATLAEMARFQKAAEKARKRLRLGESTLYLTGCKETAAMRRASLDLAHALVALRKP